MNWNSKFDLSDSRALVSDDRTDRCEHVETDSKLAYIVLAEDDSFGPVLRNVVCKACYDAHTAEEDAELHTCEDCKCTVPRALGVFWRWYDFYAPQGDEPLFVCDKCLTAPKHIERRRKDAAEARAEDELYRGYDDENG